MHGDANNIILLSFLGNTCPTVHPALQEGHMQHEHWNAACQLTGTPPHYTI